MIPRIRPLFVPFVVLCAARAEAQVAAPRSLAPPPGPYVIDFVSPAAGGVAMNRAGDVVGTSYVDTGCGSFCLPPLETVVWRRDGRRIVLPSVPGLTGITVRGINDDGWVAGFAGLSGTTTHAVVWQPIGETYQATDLGALPGMSLSTAAGIDNQGRVVGWSTTSNFPPSSAPFLWSLATGMVDLSQLGYPNETPVAVSPGGTVATATRWYRLGDPGSVVVMAPAPAGFYSAGEPTAINDAGDQARFLIQTSGQNLAYLYRYHHEGTWQRLSASPTGHLSRYGVGSINENRDVTATVTSAGVLARGPGGLAEPLASLLSTAYPGSAVTFAGPMNRRGQVLAQVLLGRSSRLVRLTPSTRCGGGCLRVNDLVISADFIPDPSDPSQDHCSQSLNAYDEALVTLTVTTPGGIPREGVVVSGRFLDDYWTNATVSGTTNASGFVSFTYTGLCGVGALAFVLDDASLDGAHLDKTTGLLSVWAIPTLP